MTWKAFYIFSCTMNEEKWMESPIPIKMKSREMKTFNTDGPSKTL